jgi:hypothetical protein
MFPAHFIKVYKLSLFRMVTFSSVCIGHQIYSARGNLCELEPVCLFSGTKDSFVFVFHFEKQIENKIYI